MIACLLYCYVAFWPIMLLIGGWKYEDTPTISLVRVLVLPLFATIMIRALLRNERFSLGTPFYWLCAYIIWCVINSFINPVDNRIRQIQMLADTFITPYLGYIIITNMKNKINFRVLAASMVLSGLVIAGIGMAEFMAGRNLVGPIQGNLSWDVKLFRTNGPFWDGLVYAGVLVAYIPIINYFMRKGVLNRYFGYFCTAFIILGSFLNFSRGATICIVVIPFLLAIRMRVSRLLGICFTLISGGILFYLSLDFIRSTKAYKVRSTDLSTSGGRWAMYLHELGIISANPFAGTGYGNYNKTHILDPHNSYLLELIEYGLFGFICFAGFIGSLVMKNLRQAYRANDNALLSAKISYLFLVLFLPNTSTFLHAVPFTTALMIMTAIIDLHFAESHAADSPALSLVRGNGNSLAAPDEQDCGTCAPPVPG